MAQVSRVAWHLHLDRHIGNVFRSSKVVRNETGFNIRGRMNG